MANTNQSVSSLSDLFTKLEAFLSGEGWSTHLDTGAGEFAAWKNPSGSIWITAAFQWDTGTPANIGVYQWHGQAYDTTGSTGSVPYDQDDDSGNGAASTSNSALDDQRYLALSDGLVENLWVFEDDNYWHAVVRTNTDRYVHFGSGYLTKFNDWTGGEYTYAQQVDTTFSTNTATRPGSTYLLDGLCADQSPGLTDMEERCATLHIEGMAEQTTEKWAVVMGQQNSANLGTARNGDDRIHVAGGFRGGLFTPPFFGQLAGTLARGLVPIYPIVVSYWDRTANEVYGPLGQMPDVGGVSLKNYASEQEITVGSDTWVVFPSFRRRDVDASGAGFTNLQGIAYKKVA